MGRVGESGGSREQGEGKENGDNCVQTSIKKKRDIHGLK